MNWEMTLTVERNKGRDEGREEGREEGELLMLIKLTQKKILKGKTAERIADDLEEDPVLIKTICDAVVRDSSADPEVILDILKERGMV